MRRNLPNLLNLYLRVGPKLSSTRSKYNDSYYPTEIKNKITEVKTRHPSSVFHLPIVDSVVPSPAAPTIFKPPPDTIIEEIRSVESIEQLFEIVKKEKALEQNHLTMIFRMINEFQNQKRTGYPADAIKNHIGFIKLCQKMQRVAPSMADSTDLITCLKTLVFCEVAAGSSIMKTVLQLIKSRVNELRIQNFCFLNYLLRRVKSPLADALTIALPVVFETQLETQLDVENVKSMSECLRYAIEKRIPVSKLKFIADSLLANNTKWENTQILSVIMSLSNVRYLSEHGISPLLENTLSRLAKVVNCIERRDLIIMAIKMSENYSSKSQYWYNEEFCNATAQRVVQEQWPFTSTSEIGRLFSKFSYVNFEFLDYYSSLIENVSHEKLKMHPRYLVAPFADANYKTSNMEKMVDFLLASNQSIESPIQWLRFAMGCAVLGIYPQSLISDIFEESKLNSYFAKNPSYHDWLQLDILNRSVRIECPEYDGPYPSPTLIKECHQKMYENRKQKENICVSLEKALQTGIGGLPYLASGLFTKYGHFADHVVAMRPGGYPVAINNLTTDNSTTDSDVVRYIEDLNGTNGCQILLIKLFSSTDYVTNGDRLRGVFELELRTLERAGYDVVSIHLGKWESLQDFEKIPFLMQQLRSKERLLSS